MRVDCNSWSATAELVVMGVAENFLVCWLLDEIIATESGNYEKPDLNILVFSSIVHNNFICILILRYPKGHFAMKT